jgi:hypothetical protein
VAIVNDEDLRQIPRPQPRFSVTDGFAEDRNFFEVGIDALNVGVAPGGMLRGGFQFLNEQITKGQGEFGREIAFRPPLESLPPHLSDRIELFADAPNEAIFWQRVDYYNDLFERRQRLNSAGVSGMVATFVAEGVLSPLNLIPFTGAMRLSHTFLRGAAIGAGLNLGTVAVEEAIYFQLDPWHTGKEAMFALGASAFLGGALGGLAGGLNRRSFRTFAARTDQLLNTRRHYADLGGRGIFRANPNLHQKLMRARFDAARFDKRELTDEEIDGMFAEFGTPSSRSEVQGWLESSGRTDHTQNAWLNPHQTVGFEFGESLEESRARSAQERLDPEFASGGETRARFDAVVPHQPLWLNRTFHGRRSQSFGVDGARYGDPHGPVQEQVGRLAEQRREASQRAEEQALLDSEIASESQGIVGDGPPRRAPGFTPEIPDEDIVGELQEVIEGMGPSRRLDDLDHLQMERLNESIANRESAAIDIQSSVNHVETLGISLSVEDLRRSVEIGDVFTPLFDDLEAALRPHRNALIPREVFQALLQDASNRSSEVAEAILGASTDSEALDLLVQFDALAMEIRLLEQLSDVDQLRNIVARIDDPSRSTRPGTEELLRLGFRPGDPDASFLDDFEPEMEFSPPTTRDLLAFEDLRTIRGAFAAARTQFDGSSQVWRRHNEPILRAQVQAQEASAQAMRERHQEVSLDSELEMLDREFQSAWEEPSEAMEFTIRNRWERRIEEAGDEARLNEWLARGRLREEASLAGREARALGVEAEIEMVREIDMRTGHPRIMGHRTVGETLSQLSRNREFAVGSLEAFRTRLREQLNLATADAPADVDAMHELLEAVLRRTGINDELRQVIGDLEGRLGGADEADAPPTIALTLPEQRRFLVEVRGQVQEMVAVLENDLERLHGGEDAITNEELGEAVPILPYFFSSGAQRADALRSWRRFEDGITEVLSDEALFRGDAREVIWTLANISNTRSVRNRHTIARQGIRAGIHNPEVLIRGASIMELEDELIPFLREIERGRDRATGELGDTEVPSFVLETMQEDIDSELVRIEASLINETGARNLDTLLTRRTGLEIRSAILNDVSSGIPVDEAYNGAMEGLLDVVVLSERLQMIRRTRELAVEEVTRHATFRENVLETSDLDQIRASMEEAREAEVLRSVGRRDLFLAEQEIEATTELGGDVVLPEFDTGLITLIRMFDHEDVPPSIENELLHMVGIRRELLALLTVASPNDASRARASFLRGMLRQRMDSVNPILQDIAVGVNNPHVRLTPGERFLVEQMGMEGPLSRELDARDAFDRTLLDEHGTTVEEMLEYEGARIRHMMGPERPVDEILAYTIDQAPGLTELQRASIRDMDLVGVDLQSALREVVAGRRRLPGIRQKRAQRILNDMDGNGDPPDPPRDETPIEDFFGSSRWFSKPFKGYLMTNMQGRALLSEFPEMREIVDGLLVPDLMIPDQFVSGRSRRQGDSVQSYIKAMHQLLNKAFQEAKVHYENIVRIGERADNITEEAFWVEVFRTLGRGQEVGSDLSPVAGDEVLAAARGFRETFLNEMERRMADIDIRTRDIDTYIATKFDQLKVGENRQEFIDVFSSELGQKLMDRVRGVTRRGRQIIDQRNRALLEQSESVTGPRVVTARHLVPPDIAEVIEETVRNWSEAVTSSPSDGLSPLLQDAFSETIPSRARQIRRIGSMNLIPLRERIDRHFGEGTWDRLSGQEEGDWIDVDFQTKEPFLRMNLLEVMSSYARTRLADVALETRFGSVDLADQLAQVDARVDAKIAAQPARAAEFTRLKQRFRADVGEALTNLRGLRGTPADVHSWPENLMQFQRGLRAVNYVRLGGGFLFPSLQDPGSIAMIAGVQNTARAFWDETRAAIGGLELTTDAIRRDLNHIGIAFNDILHSRVLSMFEADEYGSGQSRMQRALQSGNHFMAMASLLTQWTNFARRAASRAIYLNWLDMGDRVLMGTARPGDVALLSRLGLTEADAADFSRLSRNFSSGDGPERSLAMELWPREFEGLKNRLRLALSTEVDRAVVTPNVGDSPLSISRPAQQVIFQFRKFGISYTTKQLVPGLQRLKYGDHAFLNVVGISVALAGFGWMLRELITKREMPETDRIIQEGVVRSDLWGGIAEMDGFVAATTPIPSLRGFLGPDTHYAYRHGNMFDQFTSVVAGPSFDTVRTMARLAGLGLRAFEEGNLSNATDSQLRSLRRIMPFQNLFYASWLFDAMQNGVVDVARQHRGEQEMNEALAQRQRINVR